MKAMSTSACQTLATPEAPTTASSSPTATVANAAPDTQVSAVTRCLMAAKDDPAETEGLVLLPVTHLMGSSANAHLASLALPASMILARVGV